VLPVSTAVGAAVVLVVSLIASKVALEPLLRFDWPIVAYVAISVSIGYGPSIAWCVYSSRRWGTGRLTADFGVRFRWADFGWGPLTYVASILGAVFVSIIIVELDIPFTSNTEGIGDLDIDRTYVIALLISAVVAAPAVEELVFRGLMLRGLASRMPATLAVSAQGALFGLAHVDPERGRGNIGLALVLAMVGIVFGAAAFLLRRIGATMIAHAIFNGIAMIVVLTR